MIDFLYPAPLIDHNVMLEPINDAKILYSIETKDPLRVQVPKIIILKSKYVIHEIMLCDQKLIKKPKM